MAQPAKAYQEEFESRKKTESWSTMVTIQEFGKFGSTWSWEDWNTEGLLEFLWAGWLVKPKAT